VKALSLALGKEVAAGHVQARQRSVFGGVAGVGERQLEGVGHVLHRQPVFVRAHGGVRRAVDGGADECEPLADQFEVRGMGGVGVAAHAHRIPDDRAFGNQIELEGNRVDQKGGRRIVGAADHWRCCGISHGIL
jgi:hypothetical protein